MDNKITLSVLAQMLSVRTGRSRKECEDLLRSFFQTISGALSAGEPVKVRGFGTFKISQVDARMSVDISSGEDYEIPAHSRIVFLPAKELAGAVNAPFEMFETIELADGLSEQELQDEELPAAGDTDMPGLDKSAEDIPEPVDTQVITDASDGNCNEPDTSDAPCTSEEPAPLDAIHLQGGEEEKEGEVDEEDDEDYGDDEVSREPEKIRSRFGHGFVWGMSVALLVIVLGIGAVYFLNEDFSNNFDRLLGRERVERQDQAGKLETQAGVPEAGAVAEATDMAEIEGGMADLVEDAPSETQDEAVGSGAPDAGEKAVPTRPSDQPVYATITRTTGLGALARKYYGNYHFWPYIYMENEKILGHPDRIRPNTRVVVPSLSKYGVDPKNPADLAKAKRLDAEIYARYKKKR